MVDAVESVAVNTAFEPLIGPRIHNRRPRHSAMKSGVENRDLGNLTQHLFDNLDTFEFSAIVEGGERRNPGNSRFHFGSEPNRLFVFRASMHYAVSHNIDLSTRRDGRRLAIPQSAQ